LYPAVATVVRKAGGTEAGKTTYREREIWNQAPKATQSCCKQKEVKK